MTYRPRFVRHLKVELALLVVGCSGFSDLSEAGLFSNIRDRVFRPERCESLAIKEDVDREAKDETTTFNRKDEARATKVQALSTQENGTLVQDKLNLFIQFFAEGREEDPARITLLSLAELKIQIEAEKVAGAGGLVLRALRDGYRTKEREIFNSMIEGHEIQTRDQFDQLLRGAIAVIQPKKEEDQNRVNQSRANQSSSVESFASYTGKRQFHRLSAGEYIRQVKNGPEETQSKIVISQPFELMDTPMTQMQWARLSVATGQSVRDLVAPSHFADGENAMDVLIGNVDVRIQSDSPVENVFYLQVENLVNRVNEMSRTGDPQVQSLLADVFGSHTPGDQYDLPTLHEIEFAMSLRGKIIRSNDGSAAEAELLRSAWHEENSNLKTHSVATLPPRMVDIDGHGTMRPFFDLDGNVSIWLKGGSMALDDQGRRILPQGMIGYFPFHGSSFASSVEEVLTLRDNSISEDSRSSKIGVRLVRRSANSHTKNVNPMLKVKSRAERWLSEIRKKIGGN